MGQVIYYRKRQGQGLLHREEIVDTSENAPLLQSVSSKPTSETTRRTVRIFFILSILIMTLLLVGSCLFFFWPNSQDKIDYEKLHLVPQLLGWASAVLYCGSRIPQIMQNFRNESVDGLSLTMFVFSVCGNLTYCLSIFCKSLDKTFLLTNFPWLLGSGGTLFFDFTVRAEIYLCKSLILFFFIVDLFPVLHL
ncbi:PQ loop repeat-domain-containing protein [Phycomyces nitens]|nr:PQ loop repeat-domain-containing protein [Phycomyces nitens]